MRQLSTNKRSAANGDWGRHRHSHRSLILYLYSLHLFGFCLRQCLHSLPRWIGERESGPSFFSGCHGRPFPLSLLLESSAGETDMAQPQPGRQTARARPNLRKPAPSRCCLSAAPTAIHFSPKRKFRQYVVMPGLGVMKA